MPITVGVLGALSVSGQGGTVDLPGRRQRSLTAILALEGGHALMITGAERSILRHDPSTPVSAAGGDQSSSA
jgi:hypothetical protein